MAEFYTWTEAARDFITLLLVLCVITQTLTALLSHYRRPYSRSRLYENLMELFVLFQIVVISLPYGQVMNGYFASFIAPTGYGALLYIAAACVSLIACVVIACTKSLYPSLIIAISCLTLPAWEATSGGAYAWFYVIALLFWLLRGVHISILRYREIRTGISALSVKNAIDTMHAGVLFSSPDGFMLLINEMMQRLMTEITGKIQRNGRAFYEALSSGELRAGCQRTEYEGQIVCQLADETAWMFTKTELEIKNKPYVQLTAADITRRWMLTAQLQRQEELLKHRGDEIKDTIANLHVLSRENEIQRTKLRAHDVLGRRLTLLLRVMRGEQTPDYDLIRTQSLKLLDDLKQGQSAVSPDDRIDSLRQTFEMFGVDIQIDGELPEDDTKGHIFADIINESVTNAVRHGFATKVSVQIGHSDDSCRLEISDNGFPPAKPIVEGGGIGGMRSAIARHGGVLEVIAHPRFLIRVGLPRGEIIG